MSRFDQFSEDLELDQAFSYKWDTTHQIAAWRSLRHSIHKHVIDIRIYNFDDTVESLFQDNLIRGRGLFCTAVLEAQADCVELTNVYAALVAAINAKIPVVGDLFLKRLFYIFVSSLEIDCRPLVFSSAIFIAHLLNQKVIRKEVAFELINLVQTYQRDYSVELTATFLLECGDRLEKLTMEVNAIYDNLEEMLSSGNLDYKVKMAIDDLLEARSNAFLKYPAVVYELQLEDYEVQYTHQITLCETSHLQLYLDMFSFDDKFQLREHKYYKLRRRILCDDHSITESQVCDEESDCEMDVLPD